MMISWRPEGPPPTCKECGSFMLAKNRTECVNCGGTEAKEVKRYTILGPPRTKKTHQRIIVNRRTMRPMVLPAKTSQDWEANAITQLREQTREELRRRGPHQGMTGYLHVRALVYRDANRGDLTGYLQAIGDALERACVVENDKYIGSWDGSRKLIDRENPRVELEVEELSDP